MLLNAMEKIPSVQIFSSDNGSSLILITDELREEERFIYRYKYLDLYANLRQYIIN